MELKEALELTLEIACDNSLSEYDARHDIGLREEHERQQSALDIVANYIKKLPNVNATLQSVRGE